MNNEASTEMNNKVISYFWSWAKKMTNRIMVLDSFNVTDVNQTPVTVVMLYTILCVISSS